MWENIHFDMCAGQRHKSACISAQSDKSFLIRVLIVCMKKFCILDYLKYIQWRSDQTAIAQADLNLWWAHMSKVAARFSFATICFVDCNVIIFTLSIGTSYLLTIWKNLFCYRLMCLKYCCIYGKQCRPWSDAAFCGIWSGCLLRHVCPNT